MSKIHEKNLIFILTKQVKINIIALAVDEAWLSLVERCVRDAEAAGSNPVASTDKKHRKLKSLRCFCLQKICYLSFPVQKFS